MNSRLLLALLVVATTAATAADDSSNAAIIREVLDTNTRMLAAANSLNAEAFFAFLTEDGTIAQSGRVFPDRQVALADIKAGYQRASHIDRAFEHPTVVVLARDIALLISEGRLSATLNDGRTINGRFAVSLVFVRTADGWKVRHGHYSAPLPPN